ncbi:MAG: hypothetical protein JNL74_07900 [Fibrobacteres bacterium]|nr:hypothetical protein [Fibrobacterota bacterium]
MDTVTQQSVNAIAYDLLIEELFAFEAAGMKAKADEWRVKVRIAEAAMQFKTISFVQIADEFGLAGLNKSLEERARLEQNKEHEAMEIASEIAKPYLEKRVLSEAKLWALIDETVSRSKGDPLVKFCVMKLLYPKTSGTVKILLKQLCQLDNKAASLTRPSTKLEAYIKLDPVDLYKQNDNPPLDVVKKLVDARQLGIFDALYVAYPMIGREKRIDPIFLGVIENGCETLRRQPIIRFNSEVDVAIAKAKYYGELFEIGRWL